MAIQVVGMLALATDRQCVTASGCKLSAFEGAVTTNSLQTGGTWARASVAPHQEPLQSWGIYNLNIGVLSSGIHVKLV